MIYRIRRIVWCLCLAVFMASIALGRPSVEKVEPPNWWSGHTINPVRILVRGKGFKSARGPLNVTASDDRLQVSNVRINENGTYFFADLSIPENMPAGTYTITLQTGKEKTQFSYRIDPISRHPTELPENRISNKDIIYLIMPDRFANGNPANDRPPGTSEFANDRRNSRAWHGGDLEGIRQRLPYFKELGVTALWLTPWYDNPDNEVNCDKPWCPNTNYHGYHAIDYYGVENRFGTMADLKLLVRDARNMGIKIIQDQVANHVGHVHPWMKQRPLPNWFSEFSQNSFNNSILLSPNHSKAEYENLTRGWFNELLPDMNHSEPEVVKYSLQNAVWWIEMTGISGIRQDTIQYMPRTFIRDWSEAILRQYPNFWMVGEIFERDSAQTAFFQGGKKGWDGIDTKLPSVFDFNLWEKSQKVFTGKMPARTLRDVLKYDGLYPDINNVVLLANNHDTDRYMSLDGATEDGARLHMAFVLATRGIPQLYYGEEILMTGGHDPDNRKDFPGGWAGDSSDKFKASERTFKEQFMWEWTRDWINLRKRSEAIQKGKTIDLYYDNSVYVFARTLESADNSGKTVVFAFNVSPNERTVVIDSGNVPGFDKLKRSLGEGEISVGSGQVTIKIPRKSASAFTDLGGVE